MMGWLTELCQTPEPAFEVIERIGKVEIREYEPRVVVSVSYEGTSVQDARSTGFHSLFSYIQGDNAAHQKFPMTAPVAMTFTIEKAKASANNDESQALYHSPPLNPDLKVASIPKQCMAVIRYSGSWSEEHASKMEAALLEHLKQTRWLMQTKPVVYYYNPPFTPSWFRRNEVAVVVEPEC